MEANQSTFNHVKVVRLAGRLDSYTLPVIKKQLEEALEEQPQQIAVSMQDVTFIDSTALSALVIALKRSRESNGDLRLCCLQQPVRMIFELTRLDRVFEIFNSEQEAIRAFIEQ